MLLSGDEYVIPISAWSAMTHLDGVSKSSSSKPDLATPSLRLQQKFKGRCAEAFEFLCHRIADRTAKGNSTADWVERRGVIRISYRVEIH